MHIFISSLFAVIWLAMLVVAAADCVKSKNEYKAWWITVIVLLSFLGPVLYFQFARGRYVSDL